MSLMLFKNEGKYDSPASGCGVNSAVATVKYFSEVMGQNQLCLKGATERLATKPAPAKAGVKALVLRITKQFALCLVSNPLSQQQNLKINRNRT